MSFPTYPNYRDSGVKWLGEVPSHWRLSALKRGLSEIGSGGTPDTDKPQYWGTEEDTPWVAIGDMSDRDLIEATAKTVTQEGLDSKRLRVWPAHTLLFSMYASLGHVAVIARPAAINQALLALVPNCDLDAAFLKRWLECLRPTLREQASSNTQDNLNALKVANLPLLLPPREEQVTIAAFLDRETAKIDALIEEQRRLIALLKEKRQAVISHAVTKGLDPHAPMKDSGIEWLGEVPAHWEVKAVWMLFASGRGRVLSHSDIANNPGDYPVFSSQTENEGEMGRIGTYDFDGDYLTWTTDGANAGTVFRRSGRFNCTNVCGTLKPRTGVDLSFMQAALSQATSYFVRYDINPKLMNNVMGGIRVPVPPLSEQVKISQHIEAVTGDYAGLTEAASAAVLLLNERRAALISAAVTGKIDVRGTVAAEQEREAA